MLNILNNCKTIMFFLQRLGWPPSLHIDCTEEERFPSRGNQQFLCAGMWNDWGGNLWLHVLGECSYVIICGIFMAGWSDSFPDDNRATPSGGMCEGVFKWLSAQSHGRPGTTQGHHNWPSWELKGLCIIYKYTNMTLLPEKNSYPVCSDTTFSLPAIVLF